jgi:ribosome-associated protein
MKTPPKTKAATKAAKKPARKAAPKAASRSTAKTASRPKAVAKGKARPEPALKRKAAAPKPKPKQSGAKAKTVTKAGPKTRAPKAAPSPRDPSEMLTALAVAALEDLKAIDIKVLDVRELTTIADNMVICTGTSNRHVKSLAENVMDKAREGGNRALGVEGLAEGEWVLVNLNGVLVHVMQTQTRLHYQLEKLWDMSSH